VNVSSFASGSPGPEIAIILKLLSFSTSSIALDIASCGSMREFAKPGLDV
jgi:hypothetical protein